MQVPSPTEWGAVTLEERCSSQLALGLSPGTSRGKRRPKRGAGRVQYKNSGVLMFGMIHQKGQADFARFLFCFLGPRPQHMEVPRPGVALKLSLLACAVATAVPDLSRACSPHHRSRQCRILNPLSEARDRTRILMDTSPVHFRGATAGTPARIFITFRMC